jgi:SAM-dependent methyltransferase
MPSGADTAFPIPSRELINTLSGPGDEQEFLAVARMYRPLLISPGGLQPHHRVLDVGSGIGRMVHAVGDYITPPGGYDGIEIAPNGVRWCEEHITPTLPHFRFHHADVHNQVYNPAGKRRARVYRFPFADGTFDFVLLTSVFTHLLPRDVSHYLNEIARVLKPGGRMFGTFFLLSDERMKVVRAGGGPFRFPHRYGQPPLAANQRLSYGDCLVEYEDRPEQVVGYDERWVADQLAACGLTPDAETYYGEWDGRPSKYNGQDVVCATKTGVLTVARRVRTAVRLDGLREVLWRLRKK